MALFGKNKEHAAAAADNTAPGTTITYDPHLIEKLKSDHKTLLSMYGTVAEAAAKGEVSRIDSLLRGFKVALQDHLLLENIRLYVYLTHHLADDDTNSEIINDFRREMSRIGRTVMDFLRRYTDNPIPGTEVNEFRHELELIGEVLTARIEREESSLYPLYLGQYR